MQTRHIISTLLLALTATLWASDGDWDAKFKDLCSYDGKYCDSLKSSDHTWKKPKPEIIAAFALLKTNIQEAGRMYGVDPRAVAGAILAENSLNVTISDDVQDLLVKYKIAKTGSIFGKKFSFGWGQLYMDAAKAAEPLAAKIEMRPERNDTEIAQELLKPESAIKYVGAVLRQIQDTYASKGIDISKNPGVLDTLYNLGHAEEKARATQSSGGAPKVNYFGFFVQHYLGDIERAIAVTPPAAVPVIIAPAEPEPTLRTLQKVAKQPIRLLVSPPTCSTEGNGQVSEYNKFDSYETYSGSATLGANKSYTVLTPGMGCGLSEWTLIRGEDGTIGWVSDQTLAAMTKDEMREPPKCAFPVSDKCKADVLSKSGAIELKADLSDEGGVAIKLAGDKPKLTWKKNNIFCGNPGGGNSGNTSAVAVRPVPVTKEEAADLMRMSDDLRKKILTVLNDDRKKKDQPEISDWRDYANPYTLLDQAMNELKYLDDCAQHGNASPKFRCSVDKDRLKKALAFQIVPEPSFRDLQTITKDLAFHIERVPLPPSTIKEAEEENSKERAKLKEKFEPCKKAAAGLSKAGAYVNQIYAAIDTLPPSALRAFSEYESILDTAIHTCSAFNEIKIKTQENSGDKSNARPAFTDSYCTVSVSGTPVGGSYSTNWQSYIEPRVLMTILKTDADRDEFLNEALRVSIYPSLLTTQGLSPSSGQLAEDDCSYDPFKTSKLIENILKNKCVKAVYVPDPWLIKKLRSYGPRVRYRPFLQDDRFLVDVTDQACEGGTK